VRKRTEATSLLSAVQIDHARVDAIVIDEATGDELGRPWVALAFDVLTRMVTGFHLSMTPPTRLSAGLCLLHSVCDKTRWLEDRAIPHDWPAAGLPGAVLTDSQSFFGPRAFALACRDAGVETIASVARHAGYGGHIEAMIGRRLGGAKLLTDAARADRADQDGCGGAGAARLPLRDIERWLGAQITGHYHRKTHPALRRSPLAAWRAYEAEPSFRAPADCVKFRLSFLPEEECALGDDGLRLMGRTFRSRALADDLGAGRNRVTVKYDPRDLSRVFVKRPSGRFVRARDAGAAERDDSLSPIAWSADGDTSNALISSETPDLSMACDVRARNEAAAAHGQLLERDSAELAFSSDALEWLVNPPSPRFNGAARRTDFRSGPASVNPAAAARQSGACPRKCLSSCPFQVTDR
jgi:putative transposase